MAKHIYTYENPTSEKHLKEACEVLSSEGILALPTDTNWVFAWDAQKVKPLQQIYLLKPEHTKSKPFSLLCSDLTMVSKYANYEAASYRILKKIFPGPFTVILDSNKFLPKFIDDRRKTLGIRIPNRPLILDLISLYKAPFITSSVPDILRRSESGEEFMELPLVLDERTKKKSKLNTSLKLATYRCVVDRHQIK